MAHGAFNHSRRSYSAKFRKKLLFQRSGVYTDADRDAMSLGSHDNFFYLEPAANIAGVDPKAVHSGLYCFQCQAVVKVDVCDKRDADPCQYIRQGSGSLKIRHCRADDLTAAFRQLVD